jgi:hypothetical protein
MKKLIWALLLALSVNAFGEARGAEFARYEYTIVPLGSLTPLQKKADAGAKTNEIEKILNDKGLEGWEVVNIFAVRTTFDPNVFFVAMKRPLLEPDGPDSGVKGGK